MADLGEKIKGQLQPEFIEANRERSLEFKVGRSAARKPDYIRIAGVTRRLWNGMRVLPYTATEIRRSLERTIEILPEAARNEGSIPTLGPDSVYVEMAFSMSGDGAYSRGAITRERMYTALNSAFANAAEKRTGRPVRELAEKLLLLPARPWQRFTFEGLRRLFVEELIPTQVAWRIRGNADSDLRVAIFFSPLEPNVFGLA